MKAVLRRERRRIASRPLEPLLLVVLPAVSLVLTWAIFSAGLVKRDLLAATSTVSAGIKLRRLRAAGETEASARVRFEPVRADIHALFNPQLNYVSYIFVAFARFWGALLPLTHYLRIRVDQAMKGAPTRVSASSLLALATFAVLAPLLAWPRLRRVLRDERFWGKR